MPKQAHRSKTAATAATDEDDSQQERLPTFDGTQLDLGIWLRLLANTSYLLTSELAYYTITGAHAARDHKTVVLSLKHGILLKAGYIHRQNYTVINPPPSEDNYDSLYAKAISEGVAVPLAPTNADLPDCYPIAPDRIKALDMQLMNELLALITSTGRRQDYAKRANHSGFTLMRLFNIDKSQGLTQYAESPHLRGLKLILQSALLKRMTTKSQRQFDAIRDEIEEINCQIPDQGGKLTPSQLAEHYRRLIYRLKSESLRSALTTDLTINNVPFDDAEKTVQAITRVLTSQLVDDQFDLLEEQSDANHGSGLMGAQDPKKGGLTPGGGKPPKNPCHFCGKLHWSRKCFKNPNADDQTMKVAPKDSPAGMAWAKRLADKAAGKQATVPAAKVAEAVDTADQSMDALLAYALDSSDGETITFGAANLAHDDLSSSPLGGRPIYNNTALPLASTAHLPTPSVGTPLLSPDSRLIGSTSQRLSSQPSFKVNQHSSAELDSPSPPAEMTANGAGSTARYQTTPATINELCNDGDITHYPRGPSSVGFSLPMLIVTSLVVAAVAVTATVLICFPPTITWPPGEPCLHSHAMNMSHAFEQLICLSSALSLGAHAACALVLAASLAAVSACLTPTVSLLLRLFPQRRLLHRRTSPRAIDLSQSNFFDAQRSYMLHLAREPLRRTAHLPLHCAYFLCIILPHLLLLSIMLCPAAHVLHLHDHAHAPKHRCNHTLSSQNHRCILEWRRAHRAPRSRDYHYTSMSKALTLTCLLLAATCDAPNVVYTTTLIVASILGATFSSAIPERDLKAHPRPAYRTGENLSPDYECPPGTVYTDGVGLLSSKPSPSSPKQSGLRLIVDSGASFHVHGTLEHLTNLRPCSDSITGIDQHAHQCPQKGDLDIIAMTKCGLPQRVTITNVRYCPACNDTLISVGQLWREGRVEAIFREDGHLRTASGLMFPLLRQRGLYVLRSCPANGTHKLPSNRSNSNDQALFAHTVHSHKGLSHISSLPPDAAAAHVHRRLHLGAKRLSQLPHLTEDAPENLARARLNACPDCVTANAAHTSHSSSRYVESAPGRLVHADIAGPFVNSVRGHYNYLLVIVDDHTRFKFAFPLVDRANAPSKIRAFIASFNKMANNSGGTISPIGSLHTDGAGELTSGKFRGVLGDLGVDKTESPPEIHALNGVAERAIRSIFAHVRSDLEASGAPKSFWPHAVSHAVDILNRTSCPPHGRCTSYEALTGNKPRVMSIWPFGCLAFSVVPKAFRKKKSLDNTAVRGMHIGKSTSQPGAFDVWVPGDNKIVSSSDTYFDETFMPWRKPGDQRRSDPIPERGDADAAQPPTIPMLADVRSTSQMPRHRSTLSPQNSSAPLAPPPCPPLAQSRLDSQRRSWCCSRGRTTGPTVSSLSSNGSG